MHNTHSIFTYNRIRKIWLMKQQFFLRQEFVILTSPHYYTVGLQTEVLSKFSNHKQNRTVKFHKNVTCLNGGLLRIRQVFPVSCETLYRWVRTNCCFIGDIYVQNARNMFVLCALK